MERFEKMFSQLQRYVAITGLSIVSFTIIYFGILVELQYYAEKNSAKIKDKTELEALVDVEKMKLGLERKIITRIEENGRNYWGRTQEGIDVIVINKNHMNLGNLRHEMQHASDGQNDTKPPNFIDHYFWREPRAVIYAFKKSLEGN